MRTCQPGQCGIPIRGLGCPDSELLGDIEEYVLEDMIENGFDRISPEDIGALTDAPIIGNLVFNSKAAGEDWGNIDWGKTRVWWYPDYALRSFVDDLLEKGETIFQKAPEVDYA